MGCRKTFNIDSEYAARRGLDPSFLLLIREKWLKKLEFYKAGEIVSTTNSKGETTTYSKSQDTDGCKVSTTTYHDGSTSITKTCQDDSLYQITGTRNITKTHERGINTDGTQWEMEYIGEIGAPEWTKTTRDLQGRVINVEKANGAISINHYNNDGQLEKAVDFDGVTTLYSYLPNGDTEYVAVDINQNEIIDLAGPDQISQTISDISTYHDEPVYRTRNYTWFEGSSTGNLISTSYRSIDGQRSWSEVNDLVSTSSITVAPVNQTKTVVSTSACENGECLDKVSIQNYTNGLLTSQSTTDAGGNVISSVTYSYDELNRLESQTDHTGRTTTFVYEGATSVRTSTTVVGGDLSQTTSVAEEADNVTKSTLADGTFVFTQKNLQGQIIKRWGSRVYPVEYTYQNGRIKTMTTWKNFNTSEGAAITTWNYEHGQLVSKVDDQGNANLYTHTLGGKLKTRTWARGIVTTYSYDSAGRLTQTNFSDGTESIILTYDRQGRKSSVKDASGTRTFAYSPIGQLTSESYTSGLFDGFTINQTQDQFSRRNSFTVNDGLENVYSAQFGFDSTGRISTFTHDDHQARYGFHQNGQVNSLVLSHAGADVVSTNKTFDGLGRLSSVHHSNFSDTVQSFAYDLNDANQRTKVVESDGSAWIYQYNEKGELVSGQKYLANGTAIEGLNFGFQYTDIGNRIETNINGEVASYQTNELNQITQRDVPSIVDVAGKSDSSVVIVDDLVTVRNEDYYSAQVTVDNTVTIPYAIEIKEDGLLVGTKEGVLANNPELISYDLDGSIIEDGLWIDTRNAENRVVRRQAKFSGLEFEYDYDYRGLLFRKRKLIDGILVQERRFIYQGWNVALVLDEYNEVVESYLWGLDLSGIQDGAAGVGGLLAFTDHEADKTYYAIGNGRGDVVSYLDSDDGSVVYSTEYSPFGKRVVEQGDRVCDIGFSSNFTDETGGDVWYEMRIYSPELGRWRSRDPLGEVVSTRNGPMLNPLYGFVQNDAINNFDLLGLRKVDLIYYLSNDPDGIYTTDVENALKAVIYLSLQRALQKDRIEVKFVRRAPTSEELGPQGGGFFRCINAYGIHARADGSPPFGALGAGPLGLAGANYDFQIFPVSVRGQVSRARQRRWSVIRHVMIANTMAHESLFHIVADHGGLFPHSQSSSDETHISHNGMTRHLLYRLGIIGPDLIEDLKDELEIE